jgi:ADP-ribose pyrophosphatase YjhB (NUDIX family)
LETPIDDHKERHVCKHCNTIHYENPKIIVGCLPIFEGKIMLCRRGIEPMKNLWNIPAGFMENNETLQEGAQRETLEETGIYVEIQEIISIFHVEHYHQEHVHFKAKMNKKNWNLTKESIEIQLFDIDDIPYDAIAFQSNVFTLRNYCNNVDLKVQPLSYGRSKYH